MDLKWTGNRPEMDHKWTKMGQYSNSLITLDHLAFACYQNILDNSLGQEMDHKWAGNGSDKI